MRPEMFWIYTRLLEWNCSAIRLKKIAQEGKYNIYDKGNCSNIVINTKLYNIKSDIVLSMLDQTKIEGWARYFIYRCAYYCSIGIIKYCWIEFKLYCIEYFKWCCANLKQKNIFKIFNRLQKLFSKRTIV
jgi:hypothetical protein